MMKTTNAALADYTGCRTTKFLRWQEDIDHLEKLHYIRVSRDCDDISYSVPTEIIQVLPLSSTWAAKSEILCAKFVRV